MSHFTSARQGYSDYGDVQALGQLQKKFPLQFIILLLQRENELRVSQEFQERYRQTTERGVEGFIAVSIEIQQQVSQIFQSPATTRLNLNSNTEWCTVGL